MIDNQHRTPGGPVRRVLTHDTLHRIVAAARAATGTRDLIISALSIMDDALLAPDGRRIADGDTIRATDYAIPTSQWHTIMQAVTGRAQQWGTAAEVGLELATRFMPGHYEDPDAPQVDLDLPDYRPTTQTVVLTRDAVDVITACEAHLDQLRDAYGAYTPLYLDALHTWHHNLSRLLTMATGDRTTVSEDGPLSLYVHTSSGLDYGLIFHPTTRRCTTPGCDVQITDDGVALPNSSRVAAADHVHTPTHPLRGPRPGIWSLHS